MELIVRNFSALCTCRGPHYTLLHFPCIPFSCQFNSGVYVLQGEIDSGAWVFTSAISKGTLDVMLQEETAVFWNGKELTFSEIQKLACNLEYHEEIAAFKSTMRDLIDQEIARTGSDHTAEKLIDLFQIPLHIADREVKYCQQYHPYAMAILGYLRGERIFTTQWCGHYSFLTYQITNIAKALNSLGCLVLIPSSQYNAFDPSFHYVKMTSLFDDNRVGEMYEESIREPGNQGTVL